MSLFNRTIPSGMDVATQFMNLHSARNRRNESFGTSVMNDAIEAVGPASMITL
ncbi:MAG: hypothetical protein Q4F06_05380 [Eubacteriales bacterium]|nr:hypothetical protein [Eubacteriales bacterium]